MAFVPFVLHVTPSEPPSLLPSTFTKEPVNDARRGRRARRAWVAFTASYRSPQMDVDEFGVSAANTLALFAREFHRRLSALGSADQQFVAHGLYAKSDFLGAMQKPSLDFSH